MKLFIIKNVALYFSVIFMAMTITTSLSQINVEAAKKKSDPGNEKILTEKICPALQLIPNTTLYKKENCSSFIYQEDMDAAYRRICNVHGAGGSKKLVNECNEYKNYEKGSFEAEVSSKGYTCSGDLCSDPAADPNEKCSQDDCDFVKKYINPTINLLTAAFTIIAIASLIFGGIQYSASGGDPQKVGQAKNRIQNTIIAIVAYFFLYGFLQFLVPGGLFNRV